ncbi:CopM family metallochaperone [Bradyrhizobium prioriisuperbiae]|uniref:CopM family metallochaperone n=1 Tax=Bradyrhizobium prioriisuperbiae TaxID=2854389 RepID=UPI0028E4AAC0|nr:DUF305 domain-containing protein [Bradyrhizobium prioritasuperba]
MNLVSRAFIRKRVISLATTLTLGVVSSAFAPGHMTKSYAGSAVPVEYVAAPSALSAEAPFLSENDAAMTKMMADMAAKPTGDVDHDFVEMMIPHHQGAIDMAKALLKYGKNEQLRRLAQEIIVTQQQEIAAMRLALGEPLPPSVASPTQPERTPAADQQPVSHDTMGMAHGAMSHGSMSHNSMNMK